MNEYKVGSIAVVDHGNGNQYFWIILEVLQPSGRKSELFGRYIGCIQRHLASSGRLNRVCTVTPTLCLKQGGIEEFK